MGNASLKVIYLIMISHLSSESNKNFVIRTKILFPFFVHLRQTSGGILFAQHLWHKKRHALSCVPQDVETVFSPN